MASSLEPGAADDLKLHIGPPKGVRGTLSNTFLVRIYFSLSLSLYIYRTAKPNLSCLVDITMFLDLYLANIK